MIKLLSILFLAGLSIPAISLVLVGYVGCDRVRAVIFLCVACLGAGLTMSGCNVNHLDIAPQYAGVLMGITNCGATIPGFAGPAVVGALTENNVSIIVSLLLVFNLLLLNWSIVLWVVITVCSHFLNSFLTKCIMCLILILSRS